MLKQFIAAASVLLASVAFAAVDVNKASQAELEALKGIGPGISTRIVGERTKSNFKDWNDLGTRVKGLSGKNAQKFSSAGLTVNGATYPGSSAETAARPSKKATAATLAASGTKKK